MQEMIDKIEAINRIELRKQYTNSVHDKTLYDHCIADIKMLPTIEPEVRHGRWIECDYKHIEHGMIETEPNAGPCCSECRTAFQKKKMTYKKYCAACGARMDATNTNVGGKGGDDSAGD